MKIFSLLFIGLMFIGCGVSYKQLPAEKVPVTQIQEKVVVKSCPIPDLSQVCNFTGEGFVPTEKLLNCVVAQKKVLDSCTK